MKRFNVLIAALLELKKRIPDLRAVIAGEGYEREALEQLISRGHAETWLSLPGYLDQAELVDLYRSAWVVASSSLREGWGMTVTEAAACGTPSVVSRISGHMDAVVEGKTGLLFNDPTEMVESLQRVLTDDSLRHELGSWRATSCEAVQLGGSRQEVPLATSGRSSETARSSPSEDSSSVMWVGAGVLRQGAAVRCGTYA